VEDADRKPRRGGRAIRNGCRWSWRAGTEVPGDAGS